jgi:LmbE family N-acetylglucosaminyl deacetylase
MLKLEFPRKEKQSLEILCLGAHSDDIEIGCGGTILRLLSERDDVSIHWVVFGSSGQRDEEALASAHKFLANVREKEVVVKNFRESYFPYIGKEVKDFFEELKNGVSPDVIFTHYRHDLHQDHRVVSELTRNTFRNHLILEYEIPKYDGDMGSPNFYVPLDHNVCEAKVEIIMHSFKSQTHRQWFSEDLFFSIMRIRGMECNSQHSLAEGFYCHKACIEF